MRLGICTSPPRSQASYSRQSIHVAVIVSWHIFVYQIIGQSSGDKGRDDMWYIAKLYRII